MGLIAPLKFNNIAPEKLPGPNKKPDRLNQPPWPSGVNSLLNFRGSLSQWPTFKPLGITYLIGQIKFRLLFHGPLAEYLGVRGLSCTMSKPY